MSQQLIELTDAELDLVGGGTIDPGGPVKDLMPKEPNGHLAHLPLRENGHGNEFIVEPLIPSTHF